MQAENNIKTPIEFDDRRSCNRISKDVTVKACRIVYPMDETDMSEGKVRNISKSGALVDVPQEFESGELLQLYITLPGWRKSHPGFIRVMEDSVGSPFTAIGKVIRVENCEERYETAVKFINIDPDDYCALEGYIEKLANS